MFDRFSFDEKNNTAKISGNPKEIGQIVQFLTYHPGCILDRNNAIEVSMKLTMKDDKAKVLKEKKYHLPLNLLSGN